MRVDVLPAAGTAPQATERRWALFLDFDGTLVDLAATPDAIVVDRALPAHLAALRDRLDGALAILTGRSVAVIDAALAPHRFDAAGLHGHQFRRIAGESRPRVVSSDFRNAVDALAHRLDRMPGVIVEDKGEAVAVHWRLAPGAAQQARAAARDVAGRLGRGFRIQEGNAVVEILPAAADKGAALIRFLDRPPFAGRQPIVVGDDLTDEAGFAVANARGGLSVRIGRGASIARRRLATAAAFRALVAAWADGARIDPEADFRHDLA